MRSWDGVERVERVERVEKVEGVDASGEAQYREVPVSGTRITRSWSRSVILTLFSVHELTLIWRYAQFRM